MKKRFQVKNFYVTTLTSTHSLEIWVDKTLPVTTAPVIEDWREFFVILSPLSDTDRQVIRCYMDWADVKYYGWSVQFDKTYWSWSSVSINDVAELFNILYNYVDDFWYVEDLWWLDVRVDGWRIYKEWEIDISIPDTEFTLADNATTYIYCDDLQWEFSTTPIEPISYFVCAKIITDWWDITSIQDYRPNLMPWASWGWWSWHRIENVDQWWTQTILPQRDSLTTKKLKTYDDDIKLTTVIEGKRIATPDYIPAGETEYIEEKTQMIVEWTLTVDGTLENDWTLVLI
jgi:hypothetical protein